MVRRIRLFAFALLLLLGFAFWIKAQQETAADVLVVSGLLQVSQSLQLNVSISPPFSQPGNTVQLDAVLTNLEQVTHAPEVVFHLPHNLALDSRNLPAGVTVNVQRQTLHWLPIVAAHGSQQITLPLRLETAVINQPNQELTVILKLNGVEESSITTFWAGIPPQIEAILSPPQVSVGQPFQLRAHISGSGPFTQAWDLGDGRSLRVHDPIVLFPLPGVYEVRLDVSNPLSTASKTQLIHVVPQPVAQFTLDDLTPGVGQEVHFVNESGGAQPVEYFWEFGDGATSYEANPRHSYAGLGTYQVHLRVRNQHGESNAYWPVVVGQLPTADMVVPSSIPAGQLMPGQAFGDSSVLRFEWAMGDGRYHEGTQINHTYTQSGDYYITMIAVNEYGHTEVGRWIHVDPGLLSLYLPFISNGAGAEAAAAEDILAGLDLPPVELEQPFVLAPLEMPPNSAPAEQLFIYINETRRQFNLAPLQNVTLLSVAAQNHAADMAAHGFTAHTGSDGSSPEERFIWHGYSGGYGGETTAWGFEHAWQAVEFWVNSPSHRRIVLNEAATDVGVGYFVDFNAPNVWYWSAEFGNGFAAPALPALRLQSPAQNTEALMTTAVTYGWNWPTPLNGSQRFVLYLHTVQGAFPIAEVGQPERGAYYAVELSADNLTTGSSRLQLLPGRYEWQVKLEDGSVLAESDRRSVAFLPDPNAPTATATPTESATPLPPTPTTPTATPTLAWPTDTPPPPTPTSLPPLVTTTPNS